MGRLRGGQGYRPAFRGACRCFPRSMRERERRRAPGPPFEPSRMNAHVVVPSSILGRTDRVTAPCVSLGLGGFPPAGARADQAGGASQVSDSQSTRSLRRPSPGDDGICGGTLRYPTSEVWSPPGTEVFWCQTISNHAESSARNHTTSKRLRGRGRAPRTILAGGGSQVAHVVPASRMRGEFRCVEGVGCSCSDGRHAPATFGRHAPSRVRAAAAVAAANSGPIVTHGLQSGVKTGEEMHRSTSSQAQKIGRWTAPPVFSHILPFNGLCLYGSCRPHLRP